MTENVQQSKRLKRYNIQLHEFIANCISIHGNRYDYSLIPEDIKISKKVKIICKIHGVFEQVAFSHMDGRNCKKCTSSASAGANNSTFKKLESNIKSLKFDKITDIEVLPKSIGGASSTQVVYSCAIHGRQQISLYRLRRHRTCPLCIWEEKYPSNCNRSMSKTVYYNAVWYYSNYHWNNHNKFIDHYNYGRSANAYNLDHVYSISQGYRDNIDPYIIGHWTNLWLIPMIENSRKGRRCGKSKNMLFADYEWAKYKFNQPDLPAYKPRFKKQGLTSV